MEKVRRHEPDEGPSGAQPSRRRGERPELGRCPEVDDLLGDFSEQIGAHFG